MKKSISIVSGVLFTVLCVDYASAYIDPASTSYIVQIIAGLGIALGASIAIFWKKIRLFFRKKKMERLERKLNAKAKDK